MRHFTRFERKSHWDNSGKKKGNWRARKKNGNTEDNHRAQPKERASSNSMLRKRPSQEKVKMN